MMGNLEVTPQTSDITTDATFAVQGRKIPVSRDLLKVCSPVLSEKFTAGADNIKLPDEKYHEMLLLFKQLFPMDIVSTPIVISLCGRTYQTKTAMWGDMFYSAMITLVPPVTLVVHGLLPLHSLYNIHVLLHNM